jgi:hypothetical protein
MDKILLESFEKQAPQCKLNNEAVKHLENFFSIILPQDDKEFLLTYGSVIFETEMIDSFKMKFGEDEKIGDILNILDAQEIIESYELLRQETNYGNEPQIPVYMIPIAHMNDSYYRHYILLNTKDNSIWSTEEEKSIESEPNTYGYIAKGFTDFLNMLDYYENIENSINH